MQASMAKLFASEMVNRITAKCPSDARGVWVSLRIIPVERYYTGTLECFTIYEGTSEIQRVVISNNILKDKRKH